MVKKRILNFSQFGKLLGITREGVRWLWKLGDLPNDVEDAAGRPFWTDKRARRLLALRGVGQFAGPPKGKYEGTGRSGRKPAGASRESRPEQPLPENARAKEPSRSQTENGNSQKAPGESSRDEDPRFPAEPQQIPPQDRPEKKEPETEDTNRPSRWRP